MVVERMAKMFVAHNNNNWRFIISVGIIYSQVYVLHSLTY